MKMTKSNIDLPIKSLEKQIFEESKFAFRKLKKELSNNHKLEKLEAKIIGDDDIVDDCFEILSDEYLEQFERNEKQESSKHVSCFK